MYVRVFELVLQIAFFCVYVPHLSREQKVFGLQMYIFIFSSPMRT